MLDKLDDKDKLNLRAVVILTNNPVGESCSSAKTGAIAAAAGEAFKKGILTYVIQLGREGDDPTAPPANPPIKKADDASPLRIERVAQCEAVTTAAGRKENCFDDSREGWPGRRSARAHRQRPLELPLRFPRGSITDGSKTTLCLKTVPEIHPLFVVAPYTTRRALSFVFLRLSVVAVSVKPSMVTPSA